MGWTKAHGQYVGTLSTQEPGDPCKISSNAPENARKLLSPNVALSCSCSSAEQCLVEKGMTFFEGHKLLLCMSSAYLD